VNGGDALSDEDALLDHVRSWLSIITPSVASVLSCLSDEMVHLLQEKALVKKPNSGNAPIHYFIRRLSKYCRETYGQPLHDAVAATTAVIFNREAMDSDYVRKLL
jgi:hypothetical protein